MNEHILDHEYGQEEGLILDQDAISFLKVTSRWAKFLAIIGFLLAGLIVFMGCFQYL